MGRLKKERDTQLFPLKGNKYFPQLFPFIVDTFFQKRLVYVKQSGSSRNCLPNKMCLKKKPSVWIPLTYVYETHFTDWRLAPWVKV